ncbi:efflux RND transporter periplasmic adaptor subunit [Sphingobacterium corticibacterium]|uniref:Efflux RND transporter periplasmic adaptor subunit n=1 Tax=Sphingobacterium corticibacterium TaxID=2484746 RepID=A0A4Q6XXL4_9SPHI|nr:efflux RND transporter periplasmic adaptor subunit [Sphingobacterium corticibacterium]RZF62154.1 efflux RND transporter periplasmic adaptor subunit [Sphingobacterium corticibacterium]
MNNKKYIVVIVMWTILLQLSGCGNSENNMEERTKTDSAENILTLNEEQLRMLEPSYTSATYRDMPKTMRFNGKVDILPEYITSVSHPLGGHITAIRVVPGQVFRKGEVLAVLEDYKYVQLQEDFLMAKAQLKTAERNYRRQQELNVNRASSDRVFENAEEEYNKLRIAIRSLEQKLILADLDPTSIAENNISRSTTITAPFNGMVSHISVQKGQYVNPSDILFELVNAQGLIIHIKVFEKDLPSIQNGQELTVYTNSHPDQPLKANIMTINHYIQEDGSADVYAKFQDSPYRLALGMYLNAVVTTYKHKTIVIPETSVVSYEDKSYVFERLRQNVFRLVPLEVVSTYEGYVEPGKSELLADMDIVDRGSYDLLMAMKNKGDTE